MRPHWSPSFPRGYEGTATLSRIRKGSGFKRSARGRVLASSVIEVRAMLLSPSGAELAGLELQRFRSLSAFTAGCCPLFLSEPGKPVFLEYPSNSSRLRRRSQRACHGARSQHSGYRFGTILVNLESHRVVDLLPDRKPGNRSKVDAPTARSGSDES